MAFEELKQRHAAMWGSAPFERVAVSLADMHENVVRTLDGHAGERWLDVGSGTGELAFRAVATGAEVIGIDIASALVETARRQAGERGVDVHFQVADCEELPFDEASFDILSSSVGAIFAPDHERVAAELGRVCRPGGRLALTAWTANGPIGDFFKVIGSYSPPPMAGAGTSLQWGDRDYAEQLLGDTFELTFSEENSPWRESSAEELWELMATSFGPIKTLLSTLEPERAAGFREELLTLFAESQAADAIELDRPYLLVHGTRR
ncbi:MAG: class I SAM-dependent methyltransferase [Gaiella sp.]